MHPQKKYTIHAHNIYDVHIHMYITVRGVAPLLELIHVDITAHDRAHKIWEIHDSSIQHVCIGFTNILLSTK